jgi:hypothetical protein
MKLHLSSAADRRGTRIAETFNNIARPIVADPVSHNVYLVSASGEVGILKAKTTDFNNIFVSRMDAGMHWRPVLVFAGVPRQNLVHLQNE